MIRQFPDQAERVETGPIQFGADWPGLFIRGDNCMGYIVAIQQLLADHEQYTHTDPFTEAQVRGLIQTMFGAILNYTPNPQGKEP